MEYGCDAYRTALVQERQALDYHYASNRHHPEHYAEGVDAMTLTDLVEMLVDWEAASERRADADIIQGIGINAERFALTPQLTLILTNTANSWWGEREEPVSAFGANGLFPGSHLGMGERELFDAACDRLWGAYRGTLEGRTLEEIAEEIGLETTHVEHVVHAVAALLESGRGVTKLGDVTTAPQPYPRVS